MANIALDIEDAATRITLKTMLEAAGHRVVLEGQVVIADTPGKAIRHAVAIPALVLARAGDIRDAVAAMREGVHGYIFVPFQPGEAEVMVDRALAAAGAQPQGKSPDANSIHETETQLILETLRRCKHNHTEAARLLGIGRNTLWRKLKKIQNTDRGTS